MQLYKRYLERLKKEGNEVCGGTRLLLLVLSPLLLPSLLLKGVYWRRGFRMCFWRTSRWSRWSRRFPRLHRAPRAIVSNLQVYPKTQAQQGKTFRPWVRPVLSAEPPLKSHLCSDLSDLRSNLSDLRSNLSDLRSDLSDLRSDLSDLRSDLSDLRSDLSDLRPNLSDLRPNLSDLLSDLSNLRSDLSELQPFQPKIHSYQWGPEAAKGTRISRPYRFHHDHGTARVLVRHQEEMFIILWLS